MTNGQLAEFEIGATRLGPRRKRANRESEAREGIDVLVPCGGEDHRVRVAVDRRGRCQFELLDHLKEAEAVLRALGAPPTSCSEVRRALKGLRGELADPRQWIRWIEVGVRGVADLETWQGSGVSEPDVAKRWQEVTIPQLVGLWRKNGFGTPTVAAVWAACGFTPLVAGEWRSNGFSVDEAFLWTAAGIGAAASAAGWRAVGVNRPEETEPWVRAGVRLGTEAAVWAAGVAASNPDDVRHWLLAGATGAGDARAWRRAGVDLGCLELINTWTNAGALGGRDASDWNEAGERPEGIARWKAAGVASGRELILWRCLGVENPDDLRDWRRAGVTDGAQAEGWLRVGVRGFGGLSLWHSVGITDPQVALGWVRPAFITGFDELVAWVRAGVRDSAHARALFGRNRTPGAVYAVRSEAFKRLGTGSGSGRPGQVISARPGAIPGAVRTERYFYAFWHFCRPEEATDVVEVDIDTDGNEVSRRVLPLLPPEMSEIAEGVPRSDEQGGSQ